jgi:hypothetical protein
VEAACIITMFLLVQRKGVVDASNPWFDQAKQWRAALDEIGAGRRALAAAYSPVDAGTAITEESRLYDSSRRILI